MTEGQVATGFYSSIKDTTMDTKRCKLCRNIKPIDDFFEREDRSAGRFEWCKICMEKNGRSPDYPPISERGSGVINANFSSLQPGYNDGPS